MNHVLSLPLMRQEFHAGGLVACRYRQRPHPVRWLAGAHPQKTIQLDSLSIKKNISVAP